MPVPIPLLFGGTSNVTDLLTSSQDAGETVKTYRDLGFDRLLFCPAVNSLEQVDRLADAVL